MKIKVDSNKSKAKIQNLLLKLNFIIDYLKSLKVKIVLK